MKVYIPLYLWFLLLGMSLFVFVATGELAGVLSADQYFNFANPLYIFSVIGGISSLGFAGFCLLHIVKVVEYSIGYKSESRSWSNPDRKPRKSEGFKDWFYAFFESLTEED